MATASLGKVKISDKSPLSSMKDFFESQFGAGPYPVMNAEEKGGKMWLQLCNAGGRLLDTLFSEEHFEVVSE